MNAKTHFSAAFAAAALALVGASAAYADEVRDYPTPSTLTRAEVLADLAQSRAATGQLAQSETYGNVQTAALVRPAVTGTVISLSRVDVKNAVARAHANGTLTVAGEAYGTVVPGASVRSRDDVRAEAVAAARHGIDSKLYSGS